MRLRRVTDGAAYAVEIATGDGASDRWAEVASLLSEMPRDVYEQDVARWSSDALALLAAPDQILSALADAAQSHRGASSGATAPALPFEPRSFRDFMLYERHAIDAARGFVRTYMPRLIPLVAAYETISGATFPALRPHALWSRQPIYYMGNHLAFVGDGAAVAIPSYATSLDYELELGFVLKRDLEDATPDAAEAAIAGFVVINDFTAREVQLAEMRSGFGPQKSKHFCTGLSAELVSADDVLPRWRNLTARVRINGALVNDASSAGARWSLGEALAHVSQSERLHAGELFATGTLPGCSGIEQGRMLKAGDVVEVCIDGIGTLTNTIINKGRAP